MPRLAAFLSRELRRRVIDGTHIQGAFSFTLDWARDVENGADSESRTLTSIYRARGNNSR